MDDLKKEVEALLFASADALSMEELTIFTKKTPEEINSVVGAIKQEYEERGAPVTVIQEGTGYKFIIKDKFIPTVQKIALETELPKTIMETLAVIAYKHPALQSEITKIRTNKAYEHLRELESLGYISREKHGRTKKIKLTQKFFQYFDIPREKLHDAFSGFAEIEKLIDAKQQEARELRKEIKKKQEEQRKVSDEKKKDQNQEMKELDVKNKEMIGSLEVVEELPEEPGEENLDSLKVVKIPKKAAPTKKEELEKPHSEEEIKKNKHLEEKRKKIQDQIEEDADKLADKIIGKISSEKEEQKEDKELEEAVEEVEKDKEKLEDDFKDPVS
ncbi:MAG: SMC-Scp complex subunit ScpB [Candidatus Woesearchaeota archaeon]|jgi:segregation and condensation protein B|nr:SMC-Scp complex subunit ScpB [Candidatus Woesearchaeota archaeon]MDP7458088.1 SMC-Scp complex subunit ScpB [Candidatus Woesearchaeota archaeon]